MNLFVDLFFPACWFCVFLLTLYWDTQQQGASEACFDRPGNHSSCTLSIRVTVRPASSSHGKQQEQPPLPSVPEVKEKMPRPRELSEPSLASFVSRGTSQSGRRIAAMELFEQYNISRPSG